MKIICYVFFFLSSQLLFTQNHLPYKVGEYSAFNISFGGVKVGTAELRILSCIEINNVSSFHIVGSGKTTPVFDLFFKVRDVYETFIDTSNKTPLKFVRDISEGGYRKQQTYFFNHTNNIVTTVDSSYKCSLKSQDMLSALFYARTFSKDSLKVRSSFFVPIFMDEENYYLEIQYLYNEVLDTKWGGVNCMVFKPKMQEGRVFTEDEEMKIWVTDDENHLLIKVEAKIWAGVIKAILVDYQDLIAPLSTNN